MAKIIFFYHNNELVYCFKIRQFSDALFMFMMCESERKVNATVVIKFRIGIGS